MPTAQEQAFELHKLKQQYHDLAAKNTVKCAVCGETGYLTENRYQCFYCKQYFCPLDAKAHFVSHQDARYQTLLDAANLIGGDKHMAEPIIHEILAEAVRQAEAMKGG